MVVSNFFSGIFHRSNRECEVWKYTKSLRSYGLFSTPEALLRTTFAKEEATRVIYDQDEPVVQLRDLVQLQREEQLGREKTQL